MKPENILLQSKASSFVKLIDFGSACFGHQPIYSYIQSRHYRAPEVLLRTSYTSAIDMWSFGCIVAELFLGIPIFPGLSEFNQLHRIISMLGYPPLYLLQEGKHTRRYMDMLFDGSFSIKSPEHYAREHAEEVVISKRYFEGNTLSEVIQRYPMPNALNKDDQRIEQERRSVLLHFLSGCLQLDPQLRWTAPQALEHPFITGAPFRGGWVAPALVRPQNSSHPLPLDSIVSNSNPTIHITHAGSPPNFDQRHMTQLGVSPQSRGPLFQQSERAFAGSASFSHFPYNFSAPQGPLVSHQSHGALSNQMNLGAATQSPGQPKPDRRRRSASELQAKKPNEKPNDKPNDKPNESKEHRRPRRKRSSNPKHPGGQAQSAPTHSSPVGPLQSSLPTPEKRKEKSRKPRKSKKPSHSDDVSNEFGSWNPFDDDFLSEKDKANPNAQNKPDS